MCVCVFLLLCTINLMECLCGMSTAIAVVKRIPKATVSIYLTVIQLYLVNVFEQDNLYTLVGALTFCYFKAKQQFGKVCCNRVGVLLGGCEATAAWCPLLGCCTWRPPVGGSNPRTAM